MSDPIREAAQTDEALAAWEKVVLLERADIEAAHARRNAEQEQRIRADERAKCIAELWTLAGSPIDPPFGLSESDGPGAWYAAIREAIKALSVTNQPEEKD